MTVFDILAKYQLELLIGLGVTVQLCLLIWPIGIVGGVLLGIAAVKWRYAVGIPFRVVAFILSGIPILVFLFWLHYPLQALLQVVIPPFYTAVLALSVLDVLVVADLVRGALLDFPVQYALAGRACGLTERQIVRRIQLPILFRQVLPGLLFTRVTVLQATLFASLISVDEIFRVAQRINSEVYRPVEIYTSLALLFLVICLPLHGLAAWLRSRYTRDLSER